MGFKPASIDDVEGVSQRLVEFGSPEFAQTSDRLWIEGRDRHSDYVSQLITQVSGRPSSVPISTSEPIPRIVRVIGAQVTAVRTAAAASRVNTHTVRRPAGGPRSVQ